jgi:hypothetical protein
MHDFHTDQVFVIFANRCGERVEERPAWFDAAGNFGCNELPVCAVGGQNEIRTIGDGVYCRIRVTGRTPMLKSCSEFVCS